jgi:Mg-chelatase subunit ChlD
VARSRRPKPNAIDWHRTIRANLKHYQQEYHSIIPEKLWGFGRRQPKMKDLILLVDQSGSMAASVVYAGIVGSIMASMPSITTRFIVFDTSVVDLSEHLHDVVDLLFATQLGGGTHISKALRYARQHIRQPKHTIMVLISDLMEGGPQDDLLRQAAEIKATGVNLITLLALNDKGAPMYDHHIATQFTQLEIPTFACTPDAFPDLMAKAIKGERLRGV